MQNTNPMGTYILKTITASNRTKNESFLLISEQPPVNKLFNNGYEKTPLLAGFTYKLIITPS